MTKANIRYLKWAMNFMQTDIEQLSFGDRTKLIAEAFMYANFTLATGARGDYTAPPGFNFDKLVENTANMIKQDQEGFHGSLWGNVAHDMINAQKALKDYFDRIIDQVKLVQKNREGTNWPNIEPLHISLEADAKISLSLSIENNKSKNPDLCFSVHDQFGSNFPEILTFKLFMSLHGVPYNAFNKCPECARWFVHVTKKKKIYCSNKCASRNIVRKTREKQRAANNEEYSEGLMTGAKRARKRN